tara:strand:- start:1526 stop:1855 length:330 start_codon:yes stop_codon:yes gene_type:complete
MSLINQLSRQLTGLNIPDELEGYLIDYIKTFKIKTKKEHNRDFKFVMEDIRKINNPYFCICEDCRFRTDTKYCEGCYKDFCEECEDMEEPEDCVYYCSRCEPESEEESD